MTPARLAVLLPVLLALGCTKVRPEAASPGPDRVVLAHFTAEVDLETGKFEIRTVPVATSPAARRSDLVGLDADVTVSSTGLFINTSDNACRDSSPGNTWGATVEVHNNLTGISLSGVYAEITDFGGGTGNESCSNSEGPAELSSTYGLWAYGIIDADTMPVTRKWVFKYNSAASARFWFHGRIMGVKVSPIATAGLSINPNAGGVLDTGAGMAVTVSYDATSTFGVDFVDYAGAYVSSTPTPANAQCLARGENSIWFSTEMEYVDFRRSYVGRMDTDGANETHEVAVDLAGGVSLYPIVPDPATPDDKAWFLCTQENYIRSYTPEATEKLGAKTFLGGAEWSASWMATGADGRLYVTRYDGYVEVYSVASDPPTLEETWAVPSGCAGPTYVFRGPGTKLYFSSSVDQQVCSVTTGGVFEVEGVVGGSPQMIAFGPDGNLWATVMGPWPGSTYGGWLARVGVGAPWYLVEIPGGPWAYPRGIALGSGHLWVANNGGFYSLQVTP